METIDIINTLKHLLDSISWMWWLFKTIFIPFIISIHLISDWYNKKVDFID